MYTKSNKGAHLPNEQDNACGLHFRQKLLDQRLRDFCSHCSRRGLFNDLHHASNQLLVNNMTTTFEMKKFGNFLNKTGGEINHSQHRQLHRHTHGSCIADSPFKANFFF